MLPSELDNYDMGVDVLSETKKKGKDEEEPGNIWSGVSVNELGQKFLSYQGNH